MRTIAILITTLISSGCAYVHGSMDQVGGAPINYSALDKLVEGQTTKAQALTVLGTPSKITDEGPGLESVEYFSVKRRESYKLVFGMRTDKTSQTMNEKVVLQFKEGILQKKASSSDVH
jgi:hypothetical protein